MLLPQMLLLTRENRVILTLRAILKRYADTREPITLPRPAISLHRGEKSGHHFLKDLPINILLVLFYSCM